MNSEYSTHPGWHVPLLSGVVLKFFAFEGLLEALCIFFSTNCGERTENCDKC